jgi:hypothetical protein
VVVERVRSAFAFASKTLAPTPTDPSKDEVRSTFRCRRRTAWLVCSLRSSRSWRSTLLWITQKATTDSATKTAKTKAAENEGFRSAKYDLAGTGRL